MFFVYYYPLQKMHVHKTNQTNKKLKIRTTITYTVIIFYQKVELKRKKEDSNDNFDKYQDVEKVISKQIILL